ncbi:F0F1 ATP synthase subunit gamma [Thiohalobacter thiocyanaticus]|uniref:F0F1 ATP synthase subunit gamma n=1 Tax=Thiohalobacter thiocyanaticus TaxID=585455 RepID=A0A426QGZ7_9GAMM|nr:F0F1 ATP synthase subunit gamma [Thiohalobacter thiocyanaticus]RRQ21013.1 F0F1 ATP synthase subunit gamma [Thiohalobacter thiocyanaticus]
MESLERLHRQLDSLDELRTVVRTMKALSAASIRQYEQAVTALSGYYRTIEQGLQAVFREMEPPAPAAGQKRSAQRSAAIVFGSDHGLCGRFNEDIASCTLEHMDTKPAPREDRLILAVGARVVASLEQQGQKIEADFPAPGSAARITAAVEEILLQVDAWREQAGVHSVHLFYNRHSSGRGYRPTEIELLPIDLRRFHRLRAAPWPSRSLPAFSMEREVLLSRLLHQYLFVSIFRACAESQASEHASRLAAMQSAERNLDERLEEVTLSFRRARQNAITSELLDVVTGFEAITTGSNQG